MATQTIVTRIKNKVDTLAKWQDYTGTLLDGEIAVVRVPTAQTYTNPVTGQSEPVVELLMKVGDGSTPFADLPWMSAKASDVYDWGKAKAVVFNENNYHLEFRAADNSVIAYADLTDIDARLDALESKDITVTPSASTAGVVQSVTKGDDHEIDVTYGLVQTDDIADYAVTTSKIKNANVTAAKLATDAVETAKIKDANVTTTKIADKAVTDAKIDTVSASKVIYTPGTDPVTLPEKIEELEGQISANTNKLEGHTDAAINSMIDSKISALDGGTDSGSAGAGKYVSQVVQTDGKVATTYTAFPTAGTSAGIVKLGVTGGAATYDSIYGSDGKGGINAQVNTNKADIANLKTSIAGGVHFRGTVASAPTSSTVKVNNYDVTAGTIVIYSGKEYICSNIENGVVTWEQLGDVTRVGEISTAVDNLDKAIKALDVPTTNAVTSTHKFVSQVTQTDGKVDVTYTQPTSADVSHSGSTVKAALEGLNADKANKTDVYTKNETDDKISDALDALDYTTPTDAVTNTAITFIESVTQANGKITETVRKKLPTATAGSNGSAGTAGIVALVDSVSSTSKTNAATPNSVKTAYDLADQAVADAAEALKAAQHSHTAYENQNAFSNITVSKSGGGTSDVTVAADTTTDTVTFVGSNITITGDATNDKVTFSVAKADADGETGIVTLEDSVVNQSTTAATSKAVYSVNVKAEDAQARAGKIEANYLRVGTDNKLVQYVSGAENEIIFDCGGAE